MNPLQSVDRAFPALEVVRPWHPVPRAGPAAPRRLLDRLIAGFRLWLELERSRRQLAMLDERQLKDIGLTRGEIQLEIDKPFWSP